MPRQYSNYPLLIVLILLTIAIFGSLIYYTVKSKSEQSNLTQKQGLSLLPTPTVLSSPSSGTDLLKLSTAASQLELSTVQPTQLGFEVKTSDEHRSSTSNLNFRISYSGKTDVLKYFEISIPKAWDLSGYKEIPNGELVGNGSITESDNSQIGIKIFNQETKNNQAIWLLNFEKEGSGSIVLKSNLNQNQDGYEWIINREPFISLNVPFVAILTLFGKINDKQVIVSPIAPDDYQFSLKVVSLDGTSSFLRAKEKK